MAVRIVKRRLKDGTVKEYRYGDTAPRTVGAIIKEYRLSPEYRKLKPSSKQGYEQGFNHVRAFENSAIDAIKRRHILGQRDELANTPGLANKVIATWAVVLKHALDREYIQTSPARGIPRLKVGEHHRWSDEAVDFALETLREPIRRAVIVGLYTGQRAADCAAMKWSDYDGTGIAVVQMKTGAKLWIKAHKDLRAELDAWEKTATHILTNGDGRPWTRGSFLHAVSDAFRAHPELNGCVFHGLRKTAAARLAEAGSPTNEIASITGHKSLAMLMHYTKEADQRRMAESAIDRLEKHGNKTAKKTGPKLLKLNGR
jgi:integrase